MCIRDSDGAHAHEFHGSEQFHGRHTLWSKLDVRPETLPEQAAVLARPGCQTALSAARSRRKSETPKLWCRAADPHHG
eukprot:9415426-Alexandrium_andersonii.AAC.1